MCWRWMVDSWADSPRVAMSRRAGYNPSKPYETCPVNDRTRGLRWPKTIHANESDVSKTTSPPPKGCSRTIRRPKPKRPPESSLAPCLRLRRDLRPGRRPRAPSISPLPADLPAPPRFVHGNSPTVATAQERTVYPSAHARTVGPGRRSLVADRPNGGRRCWSSVHGRPSSCSSCIMASAPSISGRPC